MSSDQRAFLIFSGYNMRAIVAFCRTLRQMRLPIHIVARAADGPVFRTAYRRQVRAVRSTTALEWSDIERCVREARAATGIAEWVICPTSEFLNVFMLQHLGELAALNCRLPLVPPDLYRQVSSKGLFRAHCEEYGLKVPARYEGPDTAPLPFVAKPLCNVTDDKRSLYPCLIYDEEQRRAFLATENPAEFFYEELVKGQSYYLLFHIARDGAVTRFSQRNLLQQPDGKSILLARSAGLHETPVADRYAGLLKKLGFHGLAMVDLMERDGSYYHIEVNPRLWGPLQLVVDSGNGLLRAFIRDALDLPAREERPPAEKPAAYLWFGGYVRTRAAGQRPVWRADGLRSRLGGFLRPLARDVYLRRDTLGQFLFEMIQARRVMAEHGLHH